MPRKGHIAKRDVLVDPIYNSKLVTRLINKIMIDGKRGTAQKILYNAFDIVEVKTGKQPMEVFEEALENVMPQLELKARRVGGANYQVPVEVSDERRLTLGLRWLVNYARLRNEILLYINENIYTAFNIEELCAQFGISRSSLQSLFRNNLSIAPKEYVSSLKLEKSKLLIKESKFTISEIATMLGFSTIHYFSRRFKQEFGLTPTEYANKIL